MPGACDKLRSVTSPVEASIMSDYLRRGLAAANARNPVEAAQWFRKAVDENPLDATAAAWLGQALCAIGERLEGTARLFQAGEIMLKQPLAKELPKVIEVIVQLQQWGDVASALTLCRRAAEIEPNNGRIRQLLAVCLGQRNEPHQALAACNAALALIPGEPMLSVLQASLEADARRFADARNHLEALLKRPLAPLQAFRANKELARTLDALGDYDSAFAALAAAAVLARSVPEFQRFDAGLIPAMISANQEAFDRALLGRWSATTFADVRSAPTFLIGFYRSGTTLTQAVLDVHPEIYVADESDLLFEVQRELQRIDPAPGKLAEKLGRLDREHISRLRNLYWSQARGRYGDAVDRPVFIDKFTMNTIDVGLINLIFPDAKIIFMMRDPRDVCLSCFMQLMVPTPATIHLHDWSTTANFYAAVMRWWMHIRELLTLPCIEIRYEDAVTEFQPAYSKILSFLGLAWNPALTQFHQQAATKFIASPSRNQVAQPLYSSSLARWRRYESHYGPIAQILTPFVTEFGYDE
jgi:tetratricopeptide (TPR) repeat protein